MADEDIRRSAGPSGVPPLVIGPVPDGTLDAEDRRHVTGIYRFVSASSSPFDFGGGGGDASITTMIMSPSITSLFTGR